MSGKHILVGNGVNMQSGGRENSSQQIVLRVLVYNVFSVRRIDNESISFIS